MNDRIEIYRQMSAHPSESERDLAEIEAIIEELLFTSGEPLSLSQIADIIRVRKADTKKILNDMASRFSDQGRGIQIVSFSDKYQLATRPEHAEYIRKLMQVNNRQSLSRAAVETAAIIAYRQPVTRMDIDSIRGVKSDRIIGNLVERKLIREVGRMDAPGRPKLYGTTDEFLRYFGLKDISELPPIDDKQG